MNESTVCLQKLIEDNCENLDRLGEWISAQPHIPKSIPRSILIRYLKVCDFDLEEAKKRLDISVKFRINHQYLFTDRDINSEEFRRAENTVQYTAFPKLTKDGYAIESYRIINSNADNFIFKDVLKSAIMAHDVNTLIGPNINGMVQIFDAKAFTFLHFMKIVSHIQTAIHYSQYGMGSSCVHFRQVHFVNCSPFVKKVISLLKPFLTREIMDNIHCHPSGFESLHKFIDKECLPVEYGGSAGTLDEFMENTLNDLQNNRDFIRTNENFFLLNV